MTGRRVREVGIGLVLAGVSFLGVLYQVNESAARGSPDGRSDGVPRLICPLH
jgi:hypothetical protein